MFSEMSKKSIKTMCKFFSILISLIGKSQSDTVISKIADYIVLSLFSDARIKWKCFP